jgi:hypothetical protein
MSQGDRLESAREMYHAFRGERISRAEVYFGWNLE